MVSPMRFQSLVREEFGKKLSEPSWKKAMQSRLPFRKDALPRVPVLPQSHPYTHPVKLITLALLALIVGIITSAAASGSSCSLTIGGTVLPMNSVSFAQPLDDSPIGSSGPHLLGVVTQRSNHKLGYSVSLETTNPLTGAPSSQLTATATHLKTALQYNGMPVNLKTGTALLASVSSTSPKSQILSNLSVVPLAQEDKSSNDTLVLTITAN
jgi:hypothetical protein